MKIKVGPEKPKKKKVFMTETDNMTGESVTYGKKVKTVVPEGGSTTMGRRTITYSKKKK